MNRLRSIWKDLRCCVFCINTPSREKWESSDNATHTRRRKGNRYIESFSALHDKSNIDTLLSSIKVVHNKTMEGMYVYVLHARHLIFKVQKAKKAKHKTENSITEWEFRESEFVLFTSRSLFLKFICLWKITCFVDFVLGRYSHCGWFSGPGWMWKGSKIGKQRKGAPPLSSTKATHKEIFYPIFLPRNVRLIKYQS